MVINKIIIIFIIIIMIIIIVLPCNVEPVLHAVDCLLKIMMIMIKIMIIQDNVIINDKS